MIVAWVDEPLLFALSCSVLSGAVFSGIAAAATTERYVDGSLPLGSSSWTGDKTVDPDAASPEDDVEADEEVEGSR